MTGKITIEQNWHQRSEAAKSEAKKLPHGKEREALVRKARQLNTASQINEWLSSPELQPPKQCRPQLIVPPLRTRAHER
jgi:hypothetical protein